MRKHLLLLVVALCCAFYSRAQWVPIQPAFADYIRFAISPAALNGNMLDTTSAAITSLQNFTTDNNTAVTDITGIQYFDSLQHLKIQFPNLQFVPLLPSSIKSVEFKFVQSYITAPLPTGLVALNIDSTGLTTLPSLPASLRKLIIRDFINPVTLPVLPDSLQHLELLNTASALPVIPTTVKYLDLSGTQYGPINSWQVTPDTFHCTKCLNITSLPDLPINMVDLNVDSCPIVTMGDVPQIMYNLNLSSTLLTTVNMPYYIYNLYLSGMTRLTPLDYIDSIAVGNILDISYSPNANAGKLLSNIRPSPWTQTGISIYANHDNIDSIPQFRTYVTCLDLSYNSINELPEETLYTGVYPFSRATVFNLSHNLITDANPAFFCLAANYNPYVLYNSIDLSFNSLQLIYANIGWSSTILNFSNNQITDYIPDLLGDDIDLSNNPIQCLPFIGANVNHVNIDNTLIDCVPNNASVCSPPVNTCESGNTHNCPVTPVTGGHVYYDSNQNGVRDSNELLLPSQIVAMMPDRFLSSTDFTGLYKFNCKVYTSYTLTGVNNYPYRRITTAPATVYYTSWGAPDTTHDIGVYVLPNVNDLIVMVTPYAEARPGFIHHYNVSVRNEGTTVQNGNVVFYFDPALTYLQSWPAGSVSGNSITWPLTALNSLENFSANIDFVIPATVPLGYRVKAGAYAFGNVPDTTLVNNHDTITQIAIGSYDPNDKHVFPAEGLSLEQIADGNGYLEYLVRFQNTGTASAINIRVEDTLSALLDVNSFELLSGSHNYHYTIENRVLKVYFDNVNLPDSGSSERLSHGFFRYRIRPVSYVNINASIPNKAYIYFDFNPPVITNTATSVITSFFGVQPAASQLCNGEHLLLYARADIPIVSQQWYKDGMPTGIVSDSIFIDSVTSAANGRYSLHIINDTAEFISREAEVFVFNTPSANGSVRIVPDFTNPINDTLIICYYQSSGVYRNFNFLGQGMPNGTIYNLSLNGTVIQSGSGTQYNTTRAWHNGDRLILSASFPCLAAAISDTLIIKVITNAAARIVSIVPDTPHICPGTPVTFTVNSLNSGNFVEWFKNGSSLGGGYSYTFTNLSPTDDISVYTPAIQYNGCSVYSAGFDTTHVVFDTTVHLPTPALDITLTPLPFCPNSYQNFQPEVSTSNPHNSFTWSLNGQPAVHSGTNYSSYLFNYGDIVQYQLIRNDCGTDTFYSAAYTILPDTTLFGNTGIAYRDSGCQFVFVSEQAPDNAYNRIWTINGIRITGTYTSILITHSTSHPDTVIHTAFYNRPCLPASTSDTLIFPPVPKPHRNLMSLRASQPVFCPGQQITFSNPNPTESGIKWIKDGTFLSAYYDSSFNITVNTSPCIIKAVYPETTCWAADTLDITLLAGEIPATYANISYNPNLLCNQQPATFSISTDAGYYSVEWFVNDNFSSSNVLFSTVAMAGINIKAKITTGCYNPVIFQKEVNPSTVTQTPTAVLAPQYLGLCNGSSSNSFSIDGLYLGAAPDYQWFKNGNMVGGNSYYYADNALQNNDRIYCRVTSNNPCVTSNVVFSDTLTLNTGTPVTPTVALTANASTGCNAQVLSFQAHAVNGGSAPVFDWTINNNRVWDESGPAFNHAGFRNNDMVKVALHSSEPCALQPTVYSNAIQLTIGQSSIIVRDTVIASGSSIVLPNGQMVSSSGVYIDTLLSTTGCDSVITINLAVISGIADLQNSRFVNLYPIPAYNALNLAVSADYLGREYEITNMLGQLIVKERIQQTITGINTTQLPSGLYLLRVGDVVKRLIKE